MDHAGAVVGPLITFMLLAAGLASYRGIFWLAAIPAAPREVPLQAPASAFSPQLRRYLWGVLLFTPGNSSDAFCSSGPLRPPDTTGSYKERNWLQKDFDEVQLGSEGQWRGVRYCRTGDFGAIMVLALCSIV